MVRESRDVLIPFNYSIIQSHGFSRVPEIREIQHRNRKYWLVEGLEGYIDKKASILNEQFLYLTDLLMLRTDSILLKYEDMIENFDYFESALTQVFDIPQSIVCNIYESTRPVIVADESRHRRSGKVGGYKNKLSESQLHDLNRTLKPSLEMFSYV